MDKPQKQTLRAGVIDIGSSSIKLLIGEEDNKEIKLLESLKNLAPTGKQTFYKGRVSQQGINQIVSILEKYKRVLADYETDNVTVIATTAIREADNRDILLDTVKRKTGLNIEILTVGDVVYYLDAFLHHKLRDTYPVHEKNLLILELGSGSVDISVVARGLTLQNLGLSIGTLKIKQLMNDLDGSEEEIIEAITDYIKNEFSYLKRILPDLKIDDIILVDESYSYYLHNILKEKEASKFFQLSNDEAEKVNSAIANQRPEEFSRQYNIPLETAETFQAYSLILNQLFSLTRSKSIYILETSLAEALLANTLLGYELSKRYNKMNQLVSAARFLCDKYYLDGKHARFVAKMAEALFSKLKDHLGFNEDELLYLVLAAYLHDIGIFIHNRSHHKHSEYIISSFNLFRLTEEEIKIIACIARYHRKASPKEIHPLYNSLPQDKQILVQKLSAILRLVNSLDRSHKQKVNKLDVEFNKNDDLNLIVHTQDNFILEKADFASKKRFFEEITGNKVNLILK